jgi:4-amino-4-deoxychorismate lyase
MPSAPPVLAVLDAQSASASLVDVTTPVLRADDLIATRGEGVFETMRAFAGRAFLLHEHLDRMVHSAERIRLTLPDRAALEALAACALDGFGTGDGSLRIVVSKGPDGAGGGVAFALAMPVGAASVAAREHGVRAVTLTLGTPVDVRADAPWLLGGVKSTSYAGAMAALRAAEAAGAGDAIYLSGDGEVLEAPTAGVVAVVDGTPVTPPEDAVSVLPSTTTAFFGSSITRRRLPEAELRGASEVLLLSSVRGVVPVLELDGRPVGAGRIGPVARELGGRYEDAVRSVEQITR